MGTGPTKSAMLRAAWRLRSRAMGWKYPDDWWRPAVDEISSALANGEDLTHSATELGRARARSGVPIGSALEDFAALSTVMAWTAPPLHLVKALAEGWVDECERPQTCQEPLTGLTTPAYLRTRLTELYRVSAPHPPPKSTHRLVLVALDSASDPWRQAARAIVVSHKLSTLFDRGETLACLSEGTFAVLATDGPELQRRTDRLRLSLELEHAAHVWSVSLPETVGAALDLLSDVAATTVTD
ncbi:hypothetical protein RIF23_14480 [Lipingzhangella sp. LS1_29]|uniref:GGDEF domain-containing protein n=1 Tax=Lipingzhangella rawalii TaxID=2055835 RepID=A0ABU2H921_9ACTN|nr:hypothetical protein [Lipingzhangella rawalii]MDS1271502.1 hypothetical protein [Lipingzhangella rawalii]